MYPPKSLVTLPPLLWLIKDRRSESNWLQFELVVPVAAVAFRYTRLRCSYEPTAHALSSFLHPTMTFLRRRCRRRPPRRPSLTTKKHEVLTRRPIPRRHRCSSQQRTRYRQRICSASSRASRRAVRRSCLDSASQDTGSDVDMTSDRRQSCTARAPSER